MKKKITSFLLAAVLVLSMPTALFAAEASPASPIAKPVAPSDTGITPMSVSTSDIGVTRYSATSGNVFAYASFTKKASTAKCTITLQEKYNGSWRTATGIPVISYIKTVYNASSIAASKTFTLKSGTVYRAKIVFQDTNSSGTFSKTRYTGSF